MAKATPNRHSPNIKWPFTPVAPALHNYAVPYFIEVGQAQETDLAQSIEPGKVGGGGGKNYIRGGRERGRFPLREAAWQPRPRRRLVDPSAVATGQTIAVGLATEVDTARRVYLKQTGVKHKVGSFTPPTSTAVNTSVTGVGFQPKLVIFYGNKSHAPDGTGYDDSWAFFIGAEGPQGINNRGAVAFRADESDHNSGSASTDTRALWTPNDGTPAVSQAAQVVSFDGDGFTVSWNSANAANGDIRYICIGGTGVTIDVGRIGSGTGASVATTAPGFRPDGLILFSTSQTNIGSLVTSSNIRFSIGATDGTNQVALAVADTDVEPTAVTSYQRTDRVLLLPGAPDTVDAEATLTSFDSTGFTLGFSDTAAADVAIFYIAIKGAYFHVGSFDQPTSTGSQEIEIPFLAGTFITFGTGQVASSSLQTPSDAHLNLGAGTPNDSVSVWGHEADGTSRNADRSFKVNSLIRQGNSSRTTVAEAAITSFDANSVNLNWTTVDATARQSLFVAIGPGSIFAAVGQATETDTAQAITRLKTITLGQATETDTAQTVKVAPLRRLINSATETDTAFSITAAKKVSLGIATETDTAQSVNRLKTKAIGQAVETDTAQSITLASTDVSLIWRRARGGARGGRERGRYPLRETAYIYNCKTRVAAPTQFNEPPAPIVVSVGQAIETDTAQAFTHRKTKIIGVPFLGMPLPLPGSTDYEPVTEIDTAKSVIPQLGSGHTVAVNQASETDTARIVTARKTKTLSQALETETSQPIRPRRTYSIGQTSETDTALAITRRKLKAIGLAVETDTARPVSNPSGLPELHDFCAAVITEYFARTTEARISLADITMSTQSVQNINATIKSGTITQFIASVLPTPKVQISIIAEVVSKTTEAVFTVATVNQKTQRITVLNEFTTKTIEGFNIIVLVDASIKRATITEKVSQVLAQYIARIVATEPDQNVIATESTKKVSATDVVTSVTIIP